MNGLSAEFARWRDAVGEMYTNLLTFLPNIIGAVLVLVLGWVVARVLARLTAKGLSGLDSVFDRLLRRPTSAPPLMGPGARRLISRTVFWIIVLLAVTVASGIAGLDAFFSWLDQVVTYLPTLLAGILIMAGGYLVSLLVRDVTTTALHSAGMPSARAIGIAVQYAMLTTAVIVGIGQIGIDVTFLIVLGAVVVAAALGGVALAFALGARTFVANLVAARGLRQAYQPGQIAVLDGIEGEIIGFTHTGVILATERGRMTVPAKVFEEQPTLLVTGA